MPCDPLHALDRWLTSGDPHTVVLRLVCPACGEGYERVALVEYGMVFLDDESCSECGETLEEIDNG